MNEIVTGVDWIAVIVGAVLAYLLGWLWYLPKLFGRKWAEGVGLDPAGPAKLPAAAMTLQAAGTFLLSWLVGVTAKSNALLTIVLAAITIIVLMAAGGNFTNKSRYAITAEAGFVAAMVIVMIAVQGIL